jgi:predicted DNA-binding transcriptional regulator YafY
MTYQSFTRQKPATFIVEPYCLKVFKQRWYMLAYSPGLDKAMIYSLDRVHAIEPTKQKYKLPNGFNAEEYFKNTYGVTGMDEEPEVIEICIDAMQANYLRTLPLHSSQEEIERNDDYSIFRFHTFPSYEFLQELRKYGSDVEVISPESVRAEFRADTESLYRIYKQMESWV